MTRITLSLLVVGLTGAAMALIAAWLPAPAEHTSISVAAGLSLLGYAAMVVASAGIVLNALISCPPQARAAGLSTGRKCPAKP